MEGEKMFAVLQLDCSQPELLWLKIGQMHNETNLGPRSANFAAPGKRNAPTTAEPVPRSGTTWALTGCLAGPDSWRRFIGVRSAIWDSRAGAALIMINAASA